MDACGVGVHGDRPVLPFADCSIHAKVGIVFERVYSPRELMCTCGARLFIGQHQGGGKRILILGRIRCSNRTQWRD